ncbi:hypothetical protein DDW13_06760 [Acidianus hospitalis]|uniref:Uncharacterized protein n=1 Tax=Acidianus hospitalis TaxID=563177 RepID=A0A2T9X3J7_9CREN|nr:hypothetical protein DDW13_06760 [Acidianus hospitalis]
MAGVYNISRQNIESFGRLMFYYAVMDILISNNFTYSGIKYLNPLLEMPIGSKRADFAIVDAELNLRLLLEFKERSTPAAALEQVIEYSYLTQPAYYGVFNISVLYKENAPMPYQVNIYIFDDKFDSKCLKYKNPLAYTSHRRIYFNSLNELNEEVNKIFNLISIKTKNKIDNNIYIHSINNEAFYQYELARLLIENKIDVAIEYEYRLYALYNFVMPAKIDLVLKLWDYLIPIEVKRYGKVSKNQQEQLKRYMKVLKSHFGIVANGNDDYLILTIINNEGKQLESFSLPFTLSEDVKYLNKSKEFDNFVKTIKWHVVYDE